MLVPTSPSDRCAGIPISLTLQLGSVVGPPADPKVTMGTRVLAPILSTARLGPWPLDQRKGRQGGLGFIRGQRLAVSKFQATGGLMTSPPPLAGPWGRALWAWLVSAGLPSCTEQVRVRAPMEQTVRGHGGAPAERRGPAHLGERLLSTPRGGAEERPTCS